MIYIIAPQSPASNTPAINLIPTERSQPATNNTILISKFTPTNYSQLSYQYSQIIPKLTINNFINLENPPSSNLNFYASSKIPNCIINLSQLASTPLQIPLYQHMLNPDRAYPNALEFKQLFTFNFIFILSHLQYLYLSQHLSKPERARPNALATEQSVSFSTQIPPYQHLLTPERALPNALEIKLLKLSPLQHLYSSQ